MNSTHRLRELSHPALRHAGLFSPIDLPDLPKLGLRVGRTTHSKVLRQRDSIVTQRELLSSLILEIEDKLRILAILASEDVFSLKNGSVRPRAAVRGYRSHVSTAELPCPAAIGDARRENRLVRWSNLQCGTCTRYHLTKVPMGQFRTAISPFLFLMRLRLWATPHRGTASPLSPPFFHPAYPILRHRAWVPLYHIYKHFFLCSEHLPRFSSRIINTHQNYSSIQYPFHTRRPPYKDSPSSRSDQHSLFPFFVPPKDSVLVLLNYSGNTALSPIILDVKSRLVRDCERQAVVRTHPKFLHNLFLKNLVDRGSTATTSIMYLPT